MIGPTKACSGHGVYVTTYEDVLWALKHPEVFSSKDVVKIGNDVPLLPLSVDPPDHAKYRRLLDPQFSPKRMAELEPEARKLVNEIIDGFAGTRRVRVPRGVRDAAAVDDLPRAHGPAAGGSARSSSNGATTRSGPRRASDRRGSRREARRRGQGDRGLLRDARSRRSAAIPTTACSARIVHGEVDGRPMTHDELLGTTHLLLLGGLDTVTATLDCMIVYLARTTPNGAARSSTNPSLVPERGRGTAPPPDAGDDGAAHRRAGHRDERRARSRRATPRR